ncbi:MAG TPA: pilus assembly protein TadG-related protein [Telluria sp.]
MRDPGAGRQLRLGSPGHFQRGSISYLLLVTILVMLAFTGIALDTAMAYNRRAEVQSVADAAALAAARELNGTPAGITAAVNRAAAVVGRFKYHYDQVPMTWNDAAIEFSTTPAYGGSWRNAGSAAASPAGVYFVKVDTSQLDEAAASVEAVFMRIIGADMSATNVVGQAIAGRSAINITPLAVCAMSSAAATPRANPGPPANLELVEFGFRRGVAYNLMNLNPNAATPANFLVNPIDPPGATGNAVHTTIPIVGPFVCSGTMAMTRVTGGQIRVNSPFPIADLFRQLNSRFDQYDGDMCSPNGAPPDFNIRSFVFTSIPWMLTPPTGQTAAPLAGPTSLATIADPSPAPAGTTAGQYGPLWSFARAVPFSAYVNGSPEPASGYPYFAATAWTTLYRPGQPSTLGYPAMTPYMASGGANFQAPSASNRPGIRKRRVLNVPLLACPVSGSANVPATVLAIGKFFMTVPATETTISAEFGGVVPAETLGGPVELFP